MTEEERRAMMRSNWAAQMNGLGYDAGGNPLPRPAVIERNDELYVVLICAVRYAVGRATYMPELVTGWIRGNAPELPGKYARIMLEDIDGQRRRGGLGMDCDAAVWERFEAWLKERAKC